MQLLCIVTLEKRSHKLKVRKSPYLFLFLGAIPTPIKYCPTRT
nr:MAG TPA: hypothetical protein [Caudoviricetes sp.]